MGMVQLETPEEFPVEEPVLEPVESPAVHPAQALVEAEDLLALEELQLEPASAEDFLAPEELQLEHAPRSFSPCGGRSAV